MSRFSHFTILIFIRALCKMACLGDRGRAATGGVVAEIYAQVGESVESKDLLAKLRV